MNTQKLLRESGYPLCLEIFQRHARGETYRGLGTEFGFSVARVRDLCRKGRVAQKVRFRKTLALSGVLAAIGLRERYRIKLEECELSTRVRNALANSWLGIGPTSTLSDLCNITPAMLSTCHGIGKAVCKEIRELLDGFGLEHRLKPKEKCPYCGSLL